MEPPIKNPSLISYLTLRKVLGVLGITLPAILIAGSLIIGRCNRIQQSISDYYFTDMGSVFVGMLCAIGLFLITYKGYDPLDHLFSSLAGLFALVVAFFPTSNNPDVKCAILCLGVCKARVITHFTAAALFFIMLSLISIFLFTKSAGKKTRRKITRNRIYRTCGIIILVCILAIFLVTRINWLDHHLAGYNSILWFEWIALFSFGTSWLIKGEFLLRDN